MLKETFQEYAKSCLQQLLRLTLTSNSIQEADTYISKFEDLALKLEETKQPISDLQKTTYFLNGILRTYATTPL